eukprot:CAMPEP_0170601226 /NCGR_PEP_ID=MMETSP0224-20130122/17748_1 /TAXON_ID=285029 /ORGANISM="Togula jolla, Strain CCCM 725" /LENGTH=211 /DNA_ID=CAMNT_0010925991 /DNA_START=132 /DNA_END=764 /DNA_ORIENTATION=-
MLQESSEEEVAALGIASRGRIAGNAASTVQKLLWRLAQLKSRGGGTRCLDNETGAVAHIGVQVLVQPAGDGALRMRLVAAAGFDVALTIGLAIGRRGAWNPAPSLALLLALADVAASGTAVGCRNFSQVSAATLDVEVLCTQPCMLCSRRRRRRGRDFALAAAALKDNAKTATSPSTAKELMALEVVWTILEAAIAELGFEMLSSTCSAKL